MVDSIGSAFTTPKTSEATQAKGLFEDTGEMYLKLFLEQLKVQDPTSPFEVADMTNQLASLTNSQQLISVNSNLEQLISASSSSQASSVATLIDKQIQFKSDSFEFEGEGSINNFSYTLDKSYEAAAFEVRDAENNLVYKDDLSAVAGSYDISWEGKNQAGEYVEAGNYQVSVVGRTGADSFENAETLVSSKVTGVDFSQGDNPILLVGSGSNKIQVELPNVASVNNVEKI